MTTTRNNIDILYDKAEAAVNRLSVADNHWTFERVPGMHAWYGVNHGHHEALVTIEFDAYENLHFKVIDTGIVRFANGQQVFRFNMNTNLTDEAEDAFLDVHLIRQLNRLHGITN